jgi:DNA polymerase III epsilon subunit-like protein
MLCEDEKPENVIYDPLALEKITSHGFNLRIYEAECIDTRKFMTELYPLICGKILIGHNPTADFIHLFKASLYGKRFSSEKEFLDFLKSQMVFYDTKAIAVYFAGIPVKQTELAPLTRRVSGFDFDPAQAHDAAFDSLLTLLTFNAFREGSSRGRYQPFKSGIMFKN